MNSAEGVDGVNGANREAAPRLTMGMFDAERFWRDPGLARLPAFADRAAERIVAAMDELLFALCEPDDLLVTRYRMDAHHLAYLHEIGFRFAASRADLDDESEERHEGKPGEEATVFDLLARSLPERMLGAGWPEGVCLSPFAVIPGVAQAAAAHRLRLDCPSAETVREVNSKLYSLELGRRLGVPSDSRIVYSHEELLARGLELLRQGSFLIKDEFGVSGKGNLLIESESILRRIAAHLATQSGQGKTVRFIVEPFLRKALDFSCQFRIAADGGYRFISVQKVVNTGFAYQGSFTADERLLAILLDADYFELMREVARELYRSGYYGDVCVDSMLLEDGRVVPIVEINARKSMSLIKHRLDRQLQQEGASGSLTSG
ncbi:hypothetical protein, partial [Paenibacillus sp. 598K]|uniref:hypothetical protein n=1 Tax=Paenibacillus sp. 598K TaxID=1117987 RepID=UPI00162A9958